MHKHAGFSLIEVMVTLVILSIGLLGVAALLVKGVSNASASESMAKATLLAADMADRIRANPAAALAPNWEYLTAYSDTAPTSPTTIAQRDKQAWLGALSDQIQQGDGEITRSASNTRGLDIKVQWNKCMGTLDKSGRDECEKDSANAVTSITYELRL